VLNGLRKQGYKLNIAMRCESPEAVQGAVTQNLGIGLLYYDAVKAAIERGSFKIIPIRGLEIEGQTHIVYHNQRSLSPNAEEFLKLLRDWRDQQSTKKPKPPLSTRAGAQINAATWAFAASALT
jgi:DNA-binding transcriptional LysR family regulator